MTGWIMVRRRGEEFVVARPSIWNATLGAEVRFRDAGGVRTRCLEAGTGGDVLFLLHGTGGHVETYAHNVVALGDDFRVVAVDMIGHGFTDKPDVPYVIPDYTAHLRDLMDSMGIDRAHFLGESLGGWVAQYLEGESPERVGKVVNCTGGVFRWPEGESELEAEQRRMMVDRSRALADLTWQNVQRRLQFLFFDPADATDELVDVRYAIYSQPRTRAVLPILHHMVPYDDPDRARYSLTEDRLAGAAHPVLYLWGDHNPGSSVESAERAAAMTPGSKLYVVTSTAHWPQWEKPDEFNRVVRDFLLA
jgi:pimeloyl-ACP methyl ester carboxylesterase